MPEWPVGTDVRRPVFRVWTRPTWQSGAWQLAAPHHGAWRITQPVEHRAFPAPASAQIEFVLGNISGQIVTRSDAPELDNAEVVIQLAYRDSRRNLPDETDTWLTVYWGKVVYTREILAAAADHDAGRVVYHCVDGLQRLFDWPLDKHWVRWDGNNFGGTTGCSGHPGYNTGDPTGRPTGNQVSSDLLGLGYDGHTYPGTGGTFTDRDAVDHALAAARPTGDVPLYLWDFATTLQWLAGINVWRVEPGDTAGDLLSRIFDRRRGLGSAYLYLGQHTGHPDSLAPRIAYYPQQNSDVSFSLPAAGGSQTLPGATSVGTDFALDLRDDHLVTAPVEIGRRHTARAEYVETVSEQIQVTVTLSGEDATVAHRAAGMVAAFNAQTAEERRSAHWHPVYQHYGLPASFDWQVSAGDGVSGIARCDYRLNDAGAIQVPANGAANDTSPLLCEILPYLDLLEGYDYSGASVGTHSGSNASVDDGQPRLPDLYELQSDGTYLLADPSIALRIDGLSLWVEYSGDQEAGTRYVSDTATAALAAGMDWEDLVFTVTLRLPHRVRLASGDPDAPQSARRVIQVPGYHLNLLHFQAIHDLDDTVSGVGYSAEKFGLNSSSSSPGILRDDRDALAALHNRAALWYRTEHRPLQWSRQGCGLFWLEDQTDRNIPRLGEVVSTLTLATGTVTIDTPITSVVWDPVRNVTTWRTDWVELDFR